MFNFLRFGFGLKAFGLRVLDKMFFDKVVLSKSCGDECLE